MKQLLIMIAILLIPSWANSQNVGRFNLNDQTYISIEVNPKVEGFTNMQVLFGKEWVLDWFANDLEDCNKKIQKCNCRRIENGNNYNSP